MLKSSERVSPAVDKKWGLSISVVYTLPIIGIWEINDQVYYSGKRPSTIGLVAWIKTHTQN
jgi:hypothetical protein